MPVSVETLVHARRPAALAAAGAQARQANPCPADALLQLLQGPWTTAVLWSLGRGGPMRFGELRRAIPGISARLLTARLRLLEEARLIEHASCPDQPRQRRYRLSARGLELGALFGQMDALVQRWARQDAQIAA